MQGLIFCLKELEIAFERYYITERGVVIMDDATYKYIAIVSDSDDSIDNIERTLDYISDKSYTNFIKKLPAIIRNENINSTYDSYISPYSELSDTSEEAFELALSSLFSDRKIFYRRERFSVLFIRIKDEMVDACWVEDDVKVIPHININFDYTFGDLCYTSKPKEITRSFLKQ